MSFNCKYEKHSNSSIERTESILKNQYTKVVQAKKSIWRMPWHWEPTKDVTSCEKLRGAANKHYYPRISE